MHMRLKKHGWKQSTNGFTIKSNAKSVVYHMKKKIWLVDE